MARKNRTQYAILGFLASEPGTGYDIRHAFEIISGFWHESYGQIYPTLRRLTDEGLVTKQAEAGAKGADRIVYEITQKGRDALEAWLEEPVRIAPERLEILLRIIFGERTEPETLIRQVEHYRSEMLKRYDECKQHEREPVEGELVLEQLTVKYGLKQIAATIEWCDETLLEMRTFCGRLLLKLNEHRLLLEFANAVPDTQKF